MIGMDSNSIRWTQTTENQKILPLLSLLENFLGPPLACWAKNLIGKNLSRDGCPTSSDLILTLLSMHAIYMFPSQGSRHVALPEMHDGHFGV